jgi:hypothetical protein
MKQNLVFAVIFGISALTLACGNKNPAAQAAPTQAAAAPVPGTEPLPEPTSPPSPTPIPASLIGTRWIEIKSSPVDASIRKIRILSPDKVAVGLDCEFGNHKWSNAVDYKIQNARVDGMTVTFSDLVDLVAPDTNDQCGFSLNKNTMISWTFEVDGEVATVHSSSHLLIKFQREQPVKASTK